MLFVTLVTLVQASTREINSLYTDGNYKFTIQASTLLETHDMAIGLVKLNNGFVAFFVVFAFYSSSYFSSDIKLCLIDLILLMLCVLPITLTEVRREKNSIFWTLAHTEQLLYLKFQCKISLYVCGNIFVIISNCYYISGARGRARRTPPKGPDSFVWTYKIFKT